MLQTKIC